MSHELRTPLNSLLILSDQLAENPDGNLTRKQIEFAQTIHSSGNDLLTLINDILDLSKIESGTVVVDVGELRFGDLQRLRRAHVPPRRRGEGARASRSSSTPTLPPSVHTDAKRLQQVLKNLLSNAFKFTERGGVTLRRRHRRPRAGAPTTRRSNARHVGDRVLRHATPASASRPTSSRSSSRRSSRPTAAPAASTAARASAWRSAARSRRLLGGEIRSSSTPGEGSTFTLYLPQTYVGAAAARGSATGRSAPPCRRSTESPPCSRRSPTPR